MVNDETPICSNCFYDEGLRLDAFKIGIIDTSICPNCKVSAGNKLSKDLIHLLCYRFFVRGTIFKTEYGGSPLIQFNEYYKDKSEVDLSSWLHLDVKLIEKFGEVGLFDYGPRMWLIGDIIPLQRLRNRKQRGSIINRIINEYPTRIFKTEEHFYRLRINPNRSHVQEEFDAPPDKFLGSGRFDSKNFPVLYGSQDLEQCIHECRVTVDDQIFVAKIQPVQDLKLLDLTELLEEPEISEFDSLDIAIHFLFLAGKHSYRICRKIAEQAKMSGFDGIIYPSYFSYARTGLVPFDTYYGISIRRLPSLREAAKAQAIPNLMLFGRPLHEQKIKIVCINKLVINKVAYDYSFGPAYLKALSEE